FSDTDRLTLDHLDLRIEPGQTLALVGATGSGKTTLASLVPRLQDVTSGTVRIDGVDIRTMPVNELRHLVSVSFEDPILFSASVAEYVELGAPGADEEELCEALEIASAKDFVSRLRGDLGGQRERPGEGCRVRPARRTGQRGRRAGTAPVRRPAAAAGTAPRGHRPSEHPRPRRSALSRRRRHPGPCAAGAAGDAAGFDD